MMDAVLSTLQTIGVILLVIMFFNLMIFVHELGHFLAGKWRGAYIDRFQIWFGTPIWSKTINGVRWGIGWLPLGGFVSLPQLEDMQAVEGKADMPQNLKPLKAIDKVIIAAAGPLFSLLLAYVFAFIVWGVGKPVAEVQGTRIGYLPPESPAAEAGILPGDRILAIDGQPVIKWMGNMEGVRELVALSEGEKIHFTIARLQADGSEQTLEIASGFRVPPTAWWQRSALRQVGILPEQPAVVGTILPGSPAEKAGLQPGQKITAVNGTAVYTPYAVMTVAEKGEPLQLTLANADGTTTTTTIAPAIPTNWQGKTGAHPIMGFNWSSGPTEIEFEHPNPQAQVTQSLRWMKETLAKVCAPGSNIGMEHLSGPVGIGSYMYQMFQAGDGIGWRLVLWFAVVLNVNLAVLNILPLPVVDGGHVVLGIAEMLRGKPVSGKFLDWIMNGFVMLLLFFFVFVTFKDVGDLVGGDEAETLPEPVFSATQP
ncbi:MAG: RIP metalloprotease RseP [Akkermansia sp.]|nr:RIP metalloprotease RseP [Akkermansia sp.]